MRNRSIRAKLTIWVSFLLILLVGLSLLVVRLASGIVLRSTIRDYLIGMVEENVNKIEYTEKKGSAGANMFIPFEDGFLEIDDDFLDVVNDVRAALYTGDGTMLYGENPLAQQTEKIAFSNTRTYEMTVDDIKYVVYDRKLATKLPKGGDLWVRGIVSETESTAQLAEITRISLVLLPVLIALAVLLSFLLVGRMLRPLHEIEETATRISRGSDLKQRIDTKHRGDEVGQLANAFNHMVERLDESFEKERQFTSDASHELRTPTSVILAQTEYTLEKPRSAEEYEEALRVVQRQSRRMSTLINDMLDYSRMDGKAERYPQEPMDLSATVEEIAEQMRPLQTKGIRMQTEIEPELRITGNRGLIARMAQNLISNAYQYGKTGGMILVRVIPGNPGEGPVFSVKDDGPGISPEDQEKIFDRYYRGDASRTEQGTGLGLSMVKKIAELHGARVELESEIGSGSEFRILFPNFSEH